jgi:hypothetical protein
VRIVRVHYLPHEKTRAHDHPATPTARASLDRMKIEAGRALSSS